MTYLTINGYGVSKSLDVTDVPLLTWTNPKTGKTITLFDRVAVKFDPFMRAPRSLNDFYNSRLDQATSSAIKKAIGAAYNEELDHKISLELGGSNQFANLGINPAEGSTSQNATDTYENQLSAAVQSGAMSLVEAWRAIAKAKGFVLAEDMILQTNSDWATAAASIAGAIFKAKPTIEVKNLNANLQAQIKQDLDVLDANPYDIKTRYKVLAEQIDLTSEQLNISKNDAAAYTKVYTARYLQAKALDPQENIASLLQKEQEAMGLTSANPNILGINPNVWLQVSAVLEIAAGPAALVGGAVVALAVFFFGPAEFALAGAGGVLASITAWLGGTLGISSAVGVSAVAGAGVAYTIYETLTHIATWIPMMTKQNIDNNVYAGTMRADGFHNLIADLKKYGGATSPSTSKSSQGASSVSYPPGFGAGGVSPSSVSGTGVHVSVVSGGVLGAPNTFTPAGSDIFETMDDLQTHTEENLAQFIVGLTGSLAYRLRLVGTIRLADGTIRVGTKQRVLKGYTKAGKPEYRTVTNKFLVADISYKTLAGIWKKLDEIAIGAVDEAGFQPTTEDLANLSDAISQYLVSNQLGGITQIHLQTSGGSAPAATAPPPSTAPTTTAQSPSITKTQVKPPEPAPVPAGPAVQVSSADVSALRYGAPGVYAQLVQAGAPADTALSLAQQFSMPTPSAAAQKALSALLASLQAPSQAQATPPAPAAFAAAPTPTPAPAPSPSPVAAGPVATGLPAGVRWSNGSIYNLPAPGGFYSGPLDYAPTGALGTLYQQLGLGSSSLFVGNTGQIAALKAKLG